MPRRIVAISAMELNAASLNSGGLTVDFRKPCAKERVGHSQNHWAKKYTDQTKCYQTADNPCENEQQGQVNAAPD
jgi:hypothetical protein